MHLLLEEPLRVKNLVVHQYIIYFLGTQISIFPKCKLLRASSLKTLMNVLSWLSKISWSLGILVVAWIIEQPFVPALIKREIMARLEILFIVPLQELIFMRHWWILLWQERVDRLVRFIGCLNARLGRLLAMRILVEHRTLCLKCSSVIDLLVSKIGFEFWRQVRFKVCNIR